MSKKINCDLKIVDMQFPNIGIGYYDGKKVKVKNSLKGQVLNVNISKKRKSYEGKIIDIVSKANEEIIPDCIDFDLCGGCTYQNIPYEYELEIKKNIVLDLFDKEDIKDFKFLDIEPAPSFKNYRNKMEFSFGDNEKGGKLALGMHKRNSYYEVVTSKNCNIIDENYKKILITVLEFFKSKDLKFYHKSTREGVLRHLIIRKGEFTKEILINLVTTSNLNIDLNDLVDELLNLKLDAKIVGILHTINDSIADIVKADKVNILFGKDFYREILLGLEFKVSAFSFFQTNSAGAQKLYSTVKEFLSDSKDKIIFDLYCGTGTIAQIVSENAKKVIGIEIIEEAIESAKENAKLNNIENCEFISGDVLTTVSTLKDKPDIIILDPPRDGIHPKAIQKIIDFNAKKIIYISCKPTSLVRDLKIFLENNYKIEKVKLHDMFPRTYHVETVVELKKINI